MASPKSVQEKRMNRITAVMGAVVPTGKVLGWIVTASAAMFFAGVGFTISATEWKELPTKVDGLGVRVETAETQIFRLNMQVDSASADRRKILCLVELAATGESMSPLEVNRRCP